MREEQKDKLVDPSVEKQKPNEESSKNSQDLMQMWIEWFIKKIFGMGNEDRENKALEDMFSTSEGKEFLEMFKDPAARKELEQAIQEELPRPFRGMASWALNRMLPNPPGATNDNAATNDDNAAKEGLRPDWIENARTTPAPPSLSSGNEDDAKAKLAHTFGVANPNAPISDSANKGPLDDTFNVNSTSGVAGSLQAGG